ncbi:MAG: hypothetical protein A3B10_02500 [Candidatus Doudnabacteria bacterium RIFCSPLOWO2_01_FULL_44_21]|uniref:Uncharacterized protein n=1 Tax=Candidatus Doudnabacteria bacterium RIFCSPLOWO2_01_FULL_44_21 TaxID=1817841 RepID=A0A1F5PY30_9BACT|nr:MAG: hypothetical protein A3B95_00950 [Candidatus Doudnabacteria bacterium RIFCSPHIGHO2_02_FULL_43_13b]OGE94500.1 MAG: hypothetical protein A3B10_02500 [Candidatus Doudnabacteria bacterium RIFCSPLOWO2_01_FULL_44_21]
MDPRKKRIYIIIIVVCIFGTTAVLLWGGAFVPSFSGTDQPAYLTPNQEQTLAPSASTDGSYSTPAVFPQNTKLDTSIFDSSAFKTLKSYTPVTISPSELGRENPFAKY